MEFKETGFEGLFEIYPRILRDDRGFFMETFKLSNFQAKGIVDDFVQDNFSFSVKGVVRGLHFQKPPFAQAKLVKVSKGKVLDVVLDCRPDSLTFGKTYAVELNDIDHNMLYIPVGFAHGFAALEDSVFGYKCSNEYHKASESGVLWNDPTLNIDWKVAQPIVSEKDEVYQNFADQNFEFFRSSVLSES